MPHITADNAITPEGMPPKPADISDASHALHIAAYGLMQNIGVTGNDAKTAARITHILKHTGCSTRTDEILGKEWYNTGAVDIDIDARNEPLTASALLAIHTPPTFAARARSSKGNAAGAAVG